MVEVLSSLIERIKREIPSYPENEAVVDRGAVQPILSKLGWDTSNVFEVVPEYKAGSGRVDYCLKLAGQNKVFIEVKRLKEELDDHEEQLLRYAFEEGVELSILTNGKSWWFYLSSHTGPWNERKFFAIDLEKQDVQEIAKNFAEFLSKEGVSTGSAIRRAIGLHEGKERVRIINQTLPEAWNQLINEPDDLLADLLADKVEQLCGYKPDSERIVNFLKTEEQRKPSAPIFVPPKKARPKSAVSRLKDDFTHRKFRSFEFLGIKEDLKRNKDLLVKVSDILYQEHTDEFSTIVHDSGLFSKNPKEFRQPRKIVNTNLYIETNRSSTEIVNVCRNKLLPLFGYKPKDLKLKVVDKT